VEKCIRGREEAPSIEYSATSENTSKDNALKANCFVPTDPLRNLSTNDTNNSLLFIFSTSLSFVHGLIILIKTNFISNHNNVKLQHFLVLLPCEPPPHEKFCYWWVSLIGPQKGNQGILGQAYSSAISRVILSLEDYNKREKEEDDDRAF
jgi:hypothetical protein